MQGQWTEPRLTVGVIGLGYWGPNLVRVLSDMPDIEVSWLCDASEQHLERIARRYPAAQTSAEAEALFDDESLDAVFIATPISTHFDLASHALEAGKHAFVEKPLATSSQQVDQLLSLADANALALMCGHTFLYSPPVRRVKALIDEGALGEVHFLTSSRVNLGLHQSDVSVVWDLGPHDFSIVRYWLGEMPESVSAVGRDSIINGIPDVAFITMRFPSRILANIEVSWLAPSKLRRTVIVGTEKMVVYEDGAVEPVRIFDHGVNFEDPETFGEFQLSYRTGDIVAPHVDTTEPLALQLEEFADAIRNGDRLSEHGEICRDVVAVIESTEASIAEDGIPVSVDASVGHLG